MPQLPVDQIFQQDPEWLKQNYPQYYSSYVEKVGQPSAGLQQTTTSTAATAADIPGIQAKSGIAQTQQLQTNAPLNLKTELSKGMTLKDALSKYTAQGMSPDDVFTNYLAQSPYGMPKESPIELMNMGVSQKALGQPGQANTFADRYNTKNAVEGLRELEDQFNKTSLSARLPFLSNFDQSAKAYQAARQVIGDHLSTLIPGAPGSTGATNDLLNQIPNVGDITEMGTGAGGKQFAAIEDKLLNIKGYDPKTLGIQPRLSQVLGTSSEQVANSKTTSGKDLLNTLLQNAGGDIKGQAEGMQNNPMVSGFLNNIFNPQALAAQNNQGVNAIPAFLKQYTDIAQHPVQQATEHPVNTAMAVLGPLLGLKGVVEGESSLPSGEPTEAGVPTAPKMPNALSQILNPQGTKDFGSQLREAAVSSAQKSGATIPGDNVVAGINKWADTAMKANPGDEAKIQATVDSVTKQYAGKQVNPNDAVSIYNEIDSGFNQRGIQKETIQASRDIALRKIMSQELEKVAPGWTKGTQTIAKGFNTEEGQAHKIVKNLPQNAVRAGLNVAGFGVLKDILGL